MKLKVRIIGAGLHARESVVEIQTASGTARLALDGSYLEGDKMEVGGPVGIGRDKYLVELPQETFNGAWRVWVPRRELEGSELEGTA